MYSSGRRGVAASTALRSIPGLHEVLFCRCALECSPASVAGALKKSRPCDRGLDPVFYISGSGGWILVVPLYRLEYPAMRICAAGVKRASNLSPSVYRGSAPLFVANWPILPCETSANSAIWRCVHPSSASWPITALKSIFCFGLFISMLGLCLYPGAWSIILFLFAYYIMQSYYLLKDPAAVPLP